MTNNCMVVKTVHDENEIIKKKTYRTKKQYFTFGLALAINQFREYGGGI